MKRKLKLFGNFLHVRQTQQKEKKSLAMRKNFSIVFIFFLNFSSISFLVYGFSNKIKFQLLWMREKKEMNEGEKKKLSSKCNEMKLKLGFNFLLQWFRISFFSRSLSFFLAVTAEVNKIYLAFTGLKDVLWMWKWERHWEC